MGDATPERPDQKGPKKKGPRRQAPRVPYRTFVASEGAEVRMSPHLL